MIHRVKIEKIITGGSGLGRLENGQIVLARFVLPGETVEIRETRRRKSYLEALPVQIIQPAAERTTPPCPYFTVCGGCDFQHIDYGEQTGIKSAIAREAIQRAGVKVSEDVFHPIIASPQSFHYRYRIRLQVDADRQLGFYQAGSNDLVAIDRCLLTTDKINSALQELQEHVMLRNIPGLQEIELMQSPRDDSIFAILHLQQKTDVKSVPKDNISFKTIDTVLFKMEGKFLSPETADSDCFLVQEFSDRLCGKPFNLSWGPGCFFQVNTVQNEQLIQLVCSNVRSSGGKKLLELYCGMGNFSIPVGLAGIGITGVEQNRESIRWAAFNAKNAGLEKSNFLADDVGRYLANLVHHVPDFDTILLDPPRQGLGGNTKKVAELDPKNIIYVSCDPATLARDLGVLTGAGYSLKSLTPVDMFPQTHHIESVACLEKN